MFMQQFAAICIILFFANDIFAATGYVPIVLPVRLHHHRWRHPGGRAARGHSPDRPTGKKGPAVVFFRRDKLEPRPPRALLPLQKDPRRRVSRVLRLAAIGRAVCVLCRFLDGVGSPSVGHPWRDAASSCQGLCHGNLHSLLFFVRFCGRQGVS
uniref:Putative sugar transporter n=1 Tax=Ixodes ricinus TaxID=34613 RepID=A0A090X8W9_IXORI